MPLTDMWIRKAKAAEKPYKLTDGGGLHLNPWSTKLAAAHSADPLSELLANFKEP
ncbi:hypothetical protein [Xanthobacter sp. ZOL 2024]